LAERPIFLPQPSHPPFVEEKSIPFTWNPGLSVQQKQKNISALHVSASTLLPKEGKILEISSKSTERIGVQLSAFNLTFPAQQNAPSMSVECAFQGSKVLGKKGPYTDIYTKTSREAKHDERIRGGGILTAFRFFGIDWPTEPFTAFYDWLYINALESQNASVKNFVLEHVAFTDIEFNPAKSLNCQARSAALWVALTRNGKLADALTSQEAFLAIYGKQSGSLF
jgi:hypothetical protein